MRSALFGVSVLLGGMVGVAVMAQLVLDWQPCVMCVEIRALLLAAALLFFLAGLMGKGLARKVLVGAAVMAGGWSCWVSGGLFALEKGWVHSFGCSPFARFPSWMPLNEWVPVLFQPEGICGESVKTVLGVPLSAWPILVFIVCVVGLMGRIRRV